MTCTNPCMHAYIHIHNIYIHTYIHTITLHYSTLQYITLPYITRCMALHTLFYCMFLCYVILYHICPYWLHYILLHNIIRKSEQGSARNHWPKPGNMNPRPHLRDSPASPWRAYGLLRTWSDLGFRVSGLGCRDRIRSCMGSGAEVYGEIEL